MAMCGRRALPRRCIEGGAWVSRRLRARDSTCAKGRSPSDLYFGEDGILGTGCVQLRLVRATGWAPPSALHDRLGQVADAWYYMDLSGAMTTGWTLGARAPGSPSGLGRQPRLDEDEATPGTTSVSGAMATGTD